MIRKLLIGIGVGLVMLCIWQYKMIIYGVQQGAGQFNIVSNSIPIEDILTDETYPDSLKQKLLLIQDIRDFAIDSLGINDSENYKSMYDQKGEPVLWVVTGCPPYELNAHKWNYPVLGKLGYKGFFIKDRAIKEQEKLKKKGLDTDVDEVNAWSTLGWFKDPILSNMLYKTEGDLARLIIHELTHGTLFVSGDADFSENLATFVGDQGAYAFLKYKFGEDSDEYRLYVNQIEDIEKFSAHVIRGAKQLDSLYAKIQDLPNRAQLKIDFIQGILNTMDTVTFSTEDKYQGFIKSERLPNNTFFMDFKMYREEQSVLEKEFVERYNSEFPKYLEHLKSKYS